MVIAPIKIQLADLYESASLHVTQRLRMNNFLQNWWQTDLLYKVSAHTDQTDKDSFGRVLFRGHSRYAVFLPSTFPLSPVLLAHLLMHSNEVLIFICRYHGGVNGNPKVKVCPFLCLQLKCMVMTCPSSGKAQELICNYCLAN